jgi:hypothetical protein
LRTRGDDHNQRGDAVRSRVRESDSSRKQRWISLLSIEDRLGEGLEILHWSLSPESAQHF